MPAAVPALVMTRVVVHVEHRGVDVGGRAATGELRHVPPVRRAPAAIQQPRRPEHERAGADAEHTPAPGDGAPQRRQQRPGVVLPLQPGVAVGDGRHRHQIGLLQAFQAERGIQGEAHRGAQRPRLPGDHREVVAGQAIGGPVVAEDIAHHAQLERLEPVEHHHRDVANHGPIMPPDWQDLAHTCHHCHLSGGRP